MVEKIRKLSVNVKAKLIRKTVASIEEGSNGIGIIQSHIPELHILSNYFAFPWFATAAAAFAISS